MKCPKCKNSKLKQAVIKNIEVDYCPECKGIWLDRGEIDRLFESIESMQMEVIDVEKSFFSNLMSNIKIKN